MKLIMLLAFPLLGLIYYLFKTTKNRHNSVVFLLSLLVVLGAVFLCFFYTFITMVLPYFLEPVLLMLYYLAVCFLLLLQIYTCVICFCDETLEVYDLTLKHSHEMLQRLFAWLEDRLVHLMQV